MKRLQNKNILITGATSGIGSSCALALAANGASVIITGRDPKRGELVLDQIISSGANGCFIQCDLTNSNEVANLFERAIAYAGRIHAVFNNAGIEGELALFAESTEQNWDHVLDVNLKSIWRCMQHEIKHMLANGGGNILNMSSTSGLVGNGFGMSAYSASKFAIVGLTKSVALEYAKQNIRVNALCPAFVETPMIDAICRSNPKLKRRFEACQPMGRMATPEEIASAVVYLLSDESSFVTGNAFVVDGGLTV